MQTIENLLNGATTIATKCENHSKKEVLLIAIAMNDEAYNQLSIAGADTRYLNHNTDIELELQKMLSEF